MIASEVIFLLQEAIREHGDIPVTVATCYVGHEHNIYVEEPVTQVTKSCVPDTYPKVPAICLQGLGV